MAEFENIYIYVSDALRYDHVPETVAEEGNVIPTLVPAGYTPISFSSLVTGLDPRNHGVRSFYDSVEEETVFDRFEDHSYFDHPGDAMSRNVFGKYRTAVELEDQEPPFIHIERALDTHSPYGDIGHGNEIPDKDEEKIAGDYPGGVESTEEHFRRHVQELKDRGIYDDTLVIFTSDHGEMLGERYLGHSWSGHNIPLKRELCVVPTVFLNYENSWDRMRTIDIIPTALSILGIETVGEGLDLTQEQPDSGYTMLQVNTSPLVTTGCRWEWKEEWERGRGGIRSDLAAVALNHLEPVRQKLRHTRIADLFSSDVADQRKFHDTPLDDEDLDF